LPRCFQSVVSVYACQTRTLLKRIWIMQKQQSTHSSRNDVCCWVWNDRRTHDNHHEIKNKPSRTKRINSICRWIIAITIPPHHVTLLHVYAIISFDVGVIIELVFCLFFQNLVLGLTDCTRTLMQNSVFGWRCCFVKHPSWVTLCYILEFST